MSALAARALSLLAPPFCWGCGGAPTRDGSPLCGGCFAELRRLPAEPVVLAGVVVWAPLAYEGSAAALARALKYRGARGLAGPMAAQIVASAPPALLPRSVAAGEPRAEASPPPARAAPPGSPPPARAAPPGAPPPARTTPAGPPPPGRAAPPGAEPALVPVPLHPARRRRRGYNQAALLARAVAERTGLERADCLRRSGPRSRQVGRSREQRLAGIEGTIALRPDGAVPTHALLVDDVATTGATLAACAAALRAAGSRSVAAVTFARTPGR